jgi:hypothetical protein
MSERSVILAKIGVQPRAAFLLVIVDDEAGTVVKAEN